MVSNPQYAVSILLSILIIATLLTSHVKAQTTTTKSPLQVVVGRASNPPTIDGQWQQGEWDDAVEYQLNIGSQNLNGQPHPYLRLTHDDSKIYGLIDVPSDSGKFYVDSKGQDNWGSVFLSFYSGEVEYFFSNSTVWLDLTTNQTQRATASLFSFSNFTSTEDTNNVNGATTLTTTVHSNVTHRVWEFSVRLRPYVTSSSLNGDVSGISFVLTVQDSSSNKMLLVSSQQIATFDFAATPVPENVSIDIALPTVTLLSLIVFLTRSRRKSL